MTGQTEQERTVVGEIVGVFGVKGWVKLRSYTDPIPNILNYSPWQIELSGRWQPLKIDNGRPHGKGLVVHVVNYDDREKARVLVGAAVAVFRNQLPVTDENEYYWHDLIGLKVVTVAGVALGEVDYLLDTGANDVLVVKGERERLLPFVQGDVITEVDLDRGLIRVDWDPEF